MLFDAAFVLIVILAILLGAGAAVVMYFISRAATSDELDARGLGRKRK